MLKAFLWTGATLRNSGAKVQWALVCSPKNEGGLGFKPLKERNKAQCLGIYGRLAANLIPYGLS